MGPNNSGRDNRSEIFGTDIYLKWRPVSGGDDSHYVALQVEPLVRRRQLPGRLLVDRGGYGYLIWHFAKRWETGVRHELVTGVKEDPLDPEWSGNRNRSGMQVSFFPTEFSRFRMQVNHDRPNWREPYWGAFLTGEVLIGAHGSHKF